MERKEAIAQSIAQAAAQKQEQPEQDKPEPEETEEAEPGDVPERGEEVDEEGAAFDAAEYYASERPDDVNRRRYYRKMQRDLQGVFTKQAKKIIALARKSNNG